jgi:hypothetical protein
MKAYMEFIRASSDDESKEMLLLEEFEKTWKIVRQELREEG